jgi:acetolactate synthase-1/3 small subunit
MKKQFFQENALYKVKSSSLFEERQIQNIIKSSHATIVTVSPEFFVIEKTGFREETEKLRKDLALYGLLQFVRSGRISVTKAKMGISEILNSFKNNY